MNKRASPESEISLYFAEISVNGLDIFSCKHLKQGWPGNRAGLVFEERMRMIDFCVVLKVVLKLRC